MEDHRPIQASCQRFQLPEFSASGDGMAELDAVQRRAYQTGLDDGRERGFQQGYRDGRAAGDAAVRALALELRELLDWLAAPLERLDEAVEQSLVALATAIARQLVRGELKTDPRQVLGAVRSAMAALPLASRGARLHLHPEDALLVREALSLDDSNVAWQLLDDPLLARGGCRVETDDSRIDGTVEGRLAAVVAQMLGDERLAGG